MNNQKQALRKEFSAEELNNLIIDSIQDIKGKKIIKLDLRKLDDSPTDFFIICEGDSNVQVKAISDNINLRMKKEAATLASHIEGQEHATWICLDYFTTVVHVFHKDKRSFYELEDLWGDANITEYDSL